MKTGLVIGKFYPPHSGHRYLIDVASSQVDRLIILIGDGHDQMPNAQTRKRWIQEIHPHAHVFSIVDEYEDNNNYEQWAEDAMERLKYCMGHNFSGIDIVFGSEDYIPRYATAMGAEYQIVDQQRTLFPISGTEIRANPYQYLDELSPCVREYYVPRVVVVGAESTGTTTLSKLLAMHYSTCWVPEYGRGYTDRKMFGKTIEEVKWNSEDFYHIAMEQNRREDAAAREAHRVLICDTDAWATSIWHERYMAEISKKVKSLSDGRKYVLYVVTDINIPFIQDGMRDGEGYPRKWMHERFLEALRQEHKPFVIAKGTVEERMLTATQAIDSIIGKEMPMIRPIVREIHDERE